MNFSFVILLLWKQQQNLDSLFIFFLFPSTFLPGHKDLNTNYPPFNILHLTNSSLDQLQTRSF